MLAEDFTRFKMKIDVPIFAIDFEGSKKCGVVEFGVAEISGATVAACATGICAPRSPISARDSKFFGIGNEEASAREPFESRLEEFAKMRSRGIFAAHNAPTENSLLRSYSPIAPRSPHFVQDGKFCSTWGPWLDTMLFVKNVYPDIKSAGLSDAIEALSLQGELDALAEKFCPAGRRSWHCALYDAIASALIIISTARLEGFENMDLRWLAKFSGSANAGQDRLV